MSRPALRPPAGLSDESAAVWKNALAAMKASGAWDVVLRPFLDEYVWALQAASDARARNWHAAENRAVRRAMALADLLAITPRALKAAGLAAGDAPSDPFAEAFGPVVPINSRRKRSA